METVTTAKGCMCLFVKPPTPGEVKTRLAPEVSPDAAAFLARAFFQDTWAAVQSVSWAVPVVTTAGPLPETLVSGASQIWSQGEGDLGARLESVLRRALQQFPFAIAIGADSPGLPGRLLNDAWCGLQKADAVLGPCDDGGFYLLGLKRCPAGLLSNIPWSRSDTFHETCTRLQQAGFDVAVLDPWFDVDRPKDLDRLRNLISSGKIRAPQTKAILDRHLSRAPLLGTGKLKISVILPVLDELEWLPGTLAGLRRESFAHEIIVVDGGSSDGTKKWLSSQLDVRVTDAPRGKGPQLNAGAKAATGDVLLFLHADCLPPSDAGEQLNRVLATPSVSGGCFYVKFWETRPSSLRLVVRGINLRSRVTRSGTGDQVIFARREVFEQVGGFQDWPLFEDVDFVSRIKKRGEFTVIPSPVTLSARRYVSSGVLRTALQIWALRFAFWLGVSPFALKKCFADIRPHLQPRA